MITSDRVGWMRSLDRIAKYTRVGGDQRYPSIEAHSEEFCWAQECLSDATSSKFNDICMQYVTHRVLENILQIEPDAIGMRDVKLVSHCLKLDNDVMGRHMAADAKKTPPPARQGADKRTSLHKNDNEFVDGEWNGTYII